MDPKARLAELKALIKPLASVKSLTDEQATQLKAYLDEAERMEMLIKAADLTADEPDEIDKKIDAKLAKLAAEPPSKRAAIAAPAVKKVSKLGADETGKDGFMHWIKTGDYGALDNALKASNADPMNEQADEAGLANLPVDFYNQVIAKRNEGSIPRLTGVRAVTTDVQKIDFPVENTAATYFAVSSNDESAVDEDEPIFARTTITVFDFTKLMKVSNDLLMDARSNLESFLVDTVGRAQAITENKYFLTGAGTTVPWGITVHGTQGVTPDAGDLALEIDDVMALIYTLNSGYRDGAVLIANPTTIGNIRQLGTSTFRWWGETPGGMSSNGADWGKGSYGTVEGIPIYGSNEMATEGASKISLVFGNSNFYGLVDRSTLQVQRLTELYAGTRQTGLLWFYRAGGDVLQAEAFQYVKHPSA